MIKYYIIYVQCFWQAKKYFNTTTNKTALGKYKEEYTPHYKNRRLIFISVNTITLINANTTDSTGCMSMTALSKSVQAACDIKDTVLDYGSICVVRIARRVMKNIGGIVGQILTLTLPTAALPQTPLTHCCLQQHKWNGHNASLRVSEEWWPTPGPIPQNWAWASIAEEFLRCSLHTGIYNSTIKKINKWCNSCSD